MKNEIKTFCDNTPIPLELEGKVEEALERGKRLRRRQQRNAYWRGGSIAAACLVLVLGLNLSSGFALAMQEVPLFGSVFRVLTFRDYQFGDEIKHVEVKLPQIEAPEDGKANWTEAANETIQRVIDQQVAASEARAEDYYEAFIATGGREEDFRPVEITVDYELKYSDETYLSFLVEEYDTVASASYSGTYYNFDVTTGQALTLKDILGEDWQEKAAEQIQKQLEAFPGEKKELLDQSVDIKALLTEERDFYLNASGKPVVVFAKYELGAGALGPVEIPLEKE